MRTVGSDFNLVSQKNIVIDIHFCQDIDVISPD